MKKIEATTDAATVPAITNRLRQIGVRRITAVQVDELVHDDGFELQTLFYRGAVVTVPARRIQIQVLTEDSVADNVVSALRLLAQAERACLGSILVYPVETLVSTNARPPSEQPAATVAATA